MYARKLLSHLHIGNCLHCPASCYYGLLSFHYKLQDSGLFQVEKVLLFLFHWKKNIKYSYPCFPSPKSPPNLHLLNSMLLSSLSLSLSLSLTYTVKLQSQKTKYTNKRAFTLATFHGLSMWYLGCRSVSQEQAFSSSMTLSAVIPLG